MMDRKLLSLLAFCWLFILSQTHAFAIDHLTTFENKFGKVHDDKFLGGRDLSVEQVIAKGTFYEEAMDKSGAEAQAVVDRIRNGVSLESPFTSYSALERWGWEEQEPDSEEEDGLYDGSLDQTFSQLGINECQNQYVSWMQENPVQDDNGQTIEPSYGQYSNTYNSYDGLIISDDNNSPSSLKPQQRRVPLENWSDVAFLQWLKSCENAGTNIGSLRYVIQWNPTNGETKSILSKVLAGVPLSHLRNGVVFNKGTNAYRALLGTPNGRGAAWMLFQHKRQFGVKTIPQIIMRAVWFENRWTMLMIQRIGNVSG